MTKVRHMNERGVTLLETAIVIPLLLMLAIGLAEVGFLLIDQMAVANAAREGARVGAAAATLDEPGNTADTLILRSVEQALCQLENGRAERIVIYLADANGGVANASKVNEFVLPFATDLNCSPGGSTNFVCDTVCDWDPGDRDNIPPDIDDIGVEVFYKHDPILGIFPFTQLMDLSDRAVMRIEPDTRG